MKSSIISLACLSLLLLAQDTAAKPSTPVPGCLQKQVVPSDGSITSCYEFAEKWGTTFEKLREWNTNLHSNCDNLDVENEICVRGPDETPTSTYVPTSTDAPTSTNIPTSTYTPGSSPTSSDVAPSEAHPMLTSAKQGKYSPAPVPSPAPGGQKVKIPEETTKPKSGRTLYPNMTKSKGSRTETKNSQ
ncbi:hypothetical protein BGZ65_011916 [Modicella reniformis]|uniref:LysM domain-containing protein n=1 Tax=Modicella reniformis TaxID=1440133 RepID=A0A9P6SV10_9FUNG|nr:hypothetical protein BGZ65_011916 [Modicella reniformis]